MLTVDEGRSQEEDGSNTPRSTVPPAFDLSVMTPNASEAIAKQSSAGAAASTIDYFTPQPAASNSSSTSSTAVPPTPDVLAARSHLPPSTSHTSVSASDALASGLVLPPDATSSRPPPHTTASSISIESSASAATVTPETSSIRYPNQALSALHSQFYPPPYVPPALRQQRTSHPNQISTFTSAIASLHSSGVRTAHNSPAVTPGNAGLFSPIGPPSAPLTEGSEGSGAGTYASPFLHFTHTHVPKETHVADVDVDPVSGRKLINHYEIIDELGRGTHGKVKLGRDLHSPNNQPAYVAIKIVERFSKRRKLGRLGTTEDKVKKEVAILKKARHSNVVALLEVIDDPSRKKVYIVLEWVERGEINWRVKGPKEIGMIEARRYEREKSGNVGERALAEDAAVLMEAQKRLSRQKRRQIKAYRMMKKGVVDAPEAWSMELAGDDTESEESEDDRLSRISSHTAPSDPGKLSLDPPGRRPSRDPPPLHSSVDIAQAEHFMSLTSEPETTSPTHEELEHREDQSPRRSSGAPSMTGLEGTMYGAFDHPGQTFRVASSNSLTSSRGHSEGLSRLATEILDSHLDSELEYVPVMTMDQIRVTFRDTLLGLQYLHYQGIVHRDIKPPNLLATIENRVKISDFGVSYLGRPVREGEPGEDVSEAEAQDLDDEAKELAKTVGTPAFYAPELCNTDPTDDPLPVTKAIDVWALGVTLFCMLFARTPFVDHEFVVMRQICDEEIYLPRKRLQPVEQKPKSRSTSHGRAFPPMSTGKRHELDLVYEEISDELHDLLKRLLTKDPRKRITLGEVRHHPWVLEDVSNKLKWLEETDPSRQAEGKKIEVSKEELNTAVVPLNIVERMRSGLSGLKKVFEKTGITRARGQSNAGRDGSPAVSAGSSSTTISQDARRQSLRADDPIFAALKASREIPLPASVATSPDMERQGKDLDKPTSITHWDEELSRTPSRPTPPQRAMTIASVAGSMRTVKQSDYHQSLDSTTESPPLSSPGLPSTPRELSSPGGSALGGLLGGTSRLVKAVRDRSTNRNRQTRGLSSDRGPIIPSDRHAGASLAVSDATAAGHVNPPDSLREPTPDTSAHNSPASSRPLSVISDQHLHPAPAEPGILSRMSSTSSLASVGRQVTEAFRSSGKQRRRAPESSAEDWKRATEERIRKLVNEHRQQSEKGRSSPQRAFGSPAEPFDGGNCPDSPDDLRGRRDKSRVPSIADISNPDTPPESISPMNQTGQLPPALVSSTSDLGSAVSMSISNPSIPSAISEASSVEANDGKYEHYETKMEPSSDDTMSPVEHQDNMDEGYGPDEEAALDEDDDGSGSSSDSDGGLVMRRKSGVKSPGHGLALGGDRERRGTGLSMRSTKKSSRSGSNNTMKKVKTRDSGEGRGSLDITEE